MTEARKSPRWTNTEISVLLDCVAEWKNKLFGTASKSSAAVEKVKQQFWQTTADRISAIGVSLRTWKVVRKKWQDIASNARKWKQGFAKTGGGPMPNDNRIFARANEILAPEMYEGIVPTELGESSTSTHAEEGSSHQSFVEMLNEGDVQTDENTQTRRDHSV